MSKMYLYVPMYNFDLSNDAIAKISSPEFEFLTGVRLTITPDVVKEYYKHVLSRQSIELGFSGKTKAKKIEIALCPKYCLSIDQSYEYTLSLDRIIVIFTRVLKPSNVNMRYKLVYNSDSKRIDFHWLCGLQFIDEIHSNSKISYSEKELSTISTMLNSWVKCERKMLEAFSSTKICAAVELFNQSLLHDGIFLRIILCAVALECLFSPGNQELAHQISEHVAFFLEPKDAHKRIELYQLIKKFYKMRSEILHTGKSKTFRKCGADLILLARNSVAKSIVKCLSNDNIGNIFISDKKRRRYLKELVIGR